MEGEAPHEAHLEPGRIGKLDHAERLGERVALRARPGLKRLAGWISTRFGHSARQYTFPVSEPAVSRGPGSILGRPVLPDELEITTWELVEHGRRTSAIGLVEAVAALSAATREIGPFFEKYDAWLTPTLARRPERLGILNQSFGGAEEWWRFDCGFNPWNPVANITGQPAMSVPIHWSAEGLPIGVLLTGRFGDEATLFRLAAQVEAARPWSGHVPPIHAGGS